MGMCDGTHTHWSGCFGKPYTMGGKNIPKEKQKQEITKHIGLFFCSAFSFGYAFQK
jgi:hypothetical protein